MHDTQTCATTRAVLFWWDNKQRRHAMPIRPSRLVKDRAAKDAKRDAGFVVCVSLRVSPMERAAVSLTMVETHEEAKAEARIHATALAKAGWTPSDAVVSIDDAENGLSVGPLRVFAIGDHAQDDAARSRAEAWTRADRAVRLRIEASKR